MARLLVLYVPDLLSASKLRPALEAAGWTVAEAEDGGGFLSRAAGIPTEGGPGAAVVDLTARGGPPGGSPAEPDPVDLIRRARQRRPDLAIVAFGPHVEVGRLEAARAAGATLAVARGALLAEPAAVLERAVRATQESRPAGS